MLPKLPKPTTAELEILDVLWDRGNSTVSDVHKALESRRPMTYTTVLKFLQIMLEKGLVKRDHSAKAHVYSPAITQDTARRSLIDELLNKAFSGSALQLVQHVIETKPVGKEELDAMRRLIDAAEKSDDK